MVIMEVVAHGSSTTVVVLVGEDLDEPNIFGSTVVEVVALCERSFKMQQLVWSAVVEILSMVNEESTTTKRSSISNMKARVLARGRRRGAEDSAIGLA